MNLFTLFYDIVLHGTAQRFALPALGRAAGRRPTGKMLRRRKMLGIAPDSPASGARFVGQPACLLEQMLKKTPPLTRPTFTHNSILGNDQKQNLPKCQITKSDNHPKRLLQKWN
jgi:hypothetical protein